MAIIILIVCYFCWSMCWIYIGTRKFKKEMAEEKNVEARLTKSLKSLCEQLAIPLSYHDDLGDAAGHILYHSNMDGRLLLDSARIEILNKHKESPWVLAHELGHYMSIKQFQDRSEESADREAYKLCCSILSEKEQDLLVIPLMVYFNKDNKGDETNETIRIPAPQNKCQ